MFNKILIPVDTANSEPAKNSMELAKKLVAKDGEITLLHVVEQVPDYVLAELPKEFLENSKTSAVDQLNDLAKAANVNAEVSVVSGHAANSILRHVRDNDIELVIIASHKPEMMDYLLGSTAARVVRKAACNVLVTR